MTAAVIPRVDEDIKGTGRGSAKPRLKLGKILFAVGQNGVSEVLAVCSQAVVEEDRKFGGASPFRVRAQRGCHHRRSPGARLPEHAECFCFKNRRATHLLPPCSIFGLLGLWSSASGGGEGQYPERVNRLRFTTRFHVKLLQFWATTAAFYALTCPSLRKLDSAARADTGSRYAGNH